MTDPTYTYAIVGGGLAGASAVEGIREMDSQGSILLIGGETHLPYHRPPLTKGLWSGKDKVEEIYIHARTFYEQHAVTLRLGIRITTLDAKRKLLTDESGKTYAFEKLLLATGGAPKTLPIPGGDLPEIRYYRTLDDYHALRDGVSPGRSAIIVGGGFIGSELAAALMQFRLQVTLIFPDAYLCGRVLPDYLGQSLQRYYQDKGVRVLSSEKPIALSRREGRLSIRTDKDQQLDGDLLVVGIGIRPSVELAEQAGLKLGNGIAVNEYLQTSHPDIYAAGDNAEYVYPVLNKRLRLEHWDNALSQGKWAGRNMAGAGEKFTYQPYFFSDLFDFNYEAVGDVMAELQTYADWQDPNRTGVVYYLADRLIRGIMTCNMPDRIESARKLINRLERVLPENLAGVIR